MNKTTSSSPSSLSSTSNCSTSIQKKENISCSQNFIPDGSYYTSNPVGLRSEESIGSLASHISASISPLNLNSDELLIDVCFIL